MSKTELLIEIVRNYPILYDLSHEDYKNVRKKDKIWTDIGKELNESGDEIKKKWKNLRDTYAKHIRCNKTKTGQAGNNTKKWLWADQMKAFRPFLAFAKTSSNVSDIDSANVSEELRSETNMGCDENFENQNIQSEHSETGDTGYTEPQNTYPQVTNDIRLLHSTPLSAPTKPKTGRERNFEPSSSVAEMIKYFENKKTTKYDATDCLFLARAKTIKTFSGRRQAITKLKIAQVIMEQELLHQEELTSIQYENFSTLSRLESASSYCSNSNSIVQSGCSSVKFGDDYTLANLESNEAVERSHHSQSNFSEENSECNFAKSFNSYV